MASSSFDKVLQTDGSFRNTAADLTADLNHRSRLYDRVLGDRVLGNRVLGSYL